MRQELADRGGNPITKANPVPVEVITSEIQPKLDTQGIQFVHPYGTNVWSYHENSSLALTDAIVHNPPPTGQFLYVTDIVASIGAASAWNLFLETGDITVLGPYYLNAIGGFALHFQTPKKITTLTSLTVTTSAAIAHGIDITGFYGGE